MSVASSSTSRQAQIPFIEAINRFLTRIWTVLFSIYGTIQYVGFISHLHSYIHALISILRPSTPREVRNCSGKEKIDKPSKSSQFTNWIK